MGACVCSEASEAKERVAEMPQTGLGARSRQCRSVQPPAASHSVAAASECVWGACLACLGPATPAVPVTAKFRTYATGPL